MMSDENFNQRSGLSLLSDPLLQVSRFRDFVGVQEAPFDQLQRKRVVVHGRILPAFGPLTTGYGAPSLGILPPVIRYAISMPRPKTHLFEVSIDLPASGAGPVDLVLPA